MTVYLSAATTEIETTITTLSTSGSTGISGDISNGLVIFTHFNWRTFSIVL